MSTEGSEMGGRTGRTLPTRVIVVDAEPAQREYVRLAMTGVPNIVIVGEADSLTAAFQLLAAGPVDVVLVDLLMPEIHGFQVAHRLRQRAPHVQTVVTGDEDGPHLHRLARACGAAGYLSRRALSAQSICALTQDNLSPISATQGAPTDLPLAA